MEALVPITESQNRVRQIKSAIKRLAEENLVLRNVGDPARRYSLMLLHESGLARPEKRDYVIPEYYEGVHTAVALPVQFFTKGWIYLLTDSEIRMYLIFKHLASRFPKSRLLEGVYLTEKERAGTYDVSRDVYEAHLMLARFGLIELVPNPLRHRDGKVVDFGRVVSENGVLSPHRFRVPDDSPLFERAADKVRRALLNYPPSQGKTRLDDSLS